MRCKKCLKTFRSPPQKMKKDQICLDCQYIKYENVPSKDLNISKGQIEFLKKVANKISTDAEMMLETKIFVRDNWGSPNYFRTLCTSNEPNQLSLLIYFFQMKNKLKKVPTKENMEKISKFSIEEFENEFGTWEQFLDLVGEDPWYRDTNIEKKTYKKSKTNEKQLKENKKKRSDVQRIIEEKEEVNEEIKREVELKIIKIEERSNYVEEEIRESLEEIKNEIKIELKNNIDLLKKFESLDKFTDLLSSTKINEIKYLIR